MKASFKVNENSYARVVTGLKNIAQRVPEHAARTMRRAAARIVKNAQDYVPEDEGDLMRSIRAEERRGARNRLEIDITVGGQTVVKKNGRVVNLDQYAAIVHENYEGMLWGEYGDGPSDKTLEKMAANPGKVGSKFLSRAASEEEETLQSKMIADITQVIKEENMDR